MNYKFRKALSCVVASAVTMSVFTAIPSRVKAETVNDVKNSIKNNENKASKKLNNNNLNNNKVNEETKSNFKPNDKVVVLIETHYKCLEDYTNSKLPLYKQFENKELVEKINKSKAELRQKIKSIDPEIKIRREYMAFANGFSAEVLYKDIEKIEKLDGVKHVSLARKYNFKMNTSTKMIGSQKAWKDLGGKGGEGVVVAIVDTGIDWRHKDMRLSDPSKEKLKKSDIEKMTWQKGRWYSDKIPYGYNYGDGNDDILQDNGGSMHGMHVAGTVAGNCSDPKEIENNTGIKGVAPEAQLLAMKVGSNKPGNGSAWSDDIAAAWEDAVMHGADVINMSMGSTSGILDPDGIEEKVIRGAEERGVVGVVAQGNASYSTTPLVSPLIDDYNACDSPANTDSAIAVAAIQNTAQVVKKLTVKSKDKSLDIGFMESQGDKNIQKLLSGKFDIVFCGKGRGKNDDKKAGDDFVGKDVKGKIALIERGENTFVSKKLNAQDAGAVGVIVYDNKNESGYIGMASDSKIKIPSMFISFNDGKKLKDLIKENNNVDLKIANGYISAHFDKSRMCDFSSWGSNGNLDLKPEITAPGEFIWSTKNDNGYQNMQGTSMASPHIAGCMALITQHVNDLEKKGKIKFKTPKDRVEFIKKMAVNTSKVVLNCDNNDLPYSPRKQGAGLADVDAAIKNNVSVEYKDNGKEVVSLKEIGNNKTFALKLHNYGDSSVTYDVKSAVPEILTGNESYLKKTETGGIHDVKMEGSSVKVNQNTVTVNPGQDANVTVTLSIPSYAPKNAFAEGFIKFEPESNNTPSIGIPFMGYYGKWDAKPNIDAIKTDKNSIFGITSLITYTKDNFKDLDSSFISHNEGATDNVGLKLYPLRNIKDMNVSVLNDKGEVVRTLVNNDSVRKICLGDSDKDKPYRISKDWFWDGYKIDSNGKLTPAEDGKYKIRVKSKIEYSKANYQTMDFNVNVDSTNPNVEILNDKSSFEYGNVYNLKFKASDNGSYASGLKGFSFIVNGQKYKENGKDFFDNIKKDNNGIYTFKMNLENYKHGEKQDIQIIALDKAGNKTIQKDVLNPSLINLEFLKDNNKIADLMQLLDGNFEVKGKFKSSYKNIATAIKVLIDGKVYKEIPLDSNEFDVKFKDIASGNHKISIQIINGDKLVKSEDFNIKVQANTLGFKLDKVPSDVNEEYVTLKGSLDQIPDVFKIDNKDVSLKGFKFSVRVKLTPNIKNRIPIYIKKGNQVINYSELIICDTKAPNINFYPNSNNTKIIGDNILVNVPFNQKTYDLRCSFEENLEVSAYTVYLNGSPVTMTNKPYVLNKSIKLKDNNTILKVEAIDEIGNKSQKVIRIQKSNVDLGSFKIENLNIKGEYKNGEQFNGGIRIRNISKQGQFVTFMVALYDENNNMVNLVSNSQFVMPNNSTEFYNQFNIPSEGNYTIRCYLWDSIENMIPLNYSIPANVN